MTVPTAAELTLLRTHPQETQLWLSIYQPRTVLACQVNNGSAAPGDRLITYDGVVTGSYTQVESGMTMYIGTTPGAKDVGRIRVRSATSTVLTVAENSDIKWQDNLYLTIVKFWEIDAVYPRITSTGTTTFWYKDYDIEYTNQNDNLGTILCMGCHHAGFLDSGTGTVYYTATGTLSLLSSTPLTYSWFFEGATVTGSSSEIPGNRYYSTPGHYTTRLQVTDSLGMVDTSYRHISIYNRPGFGSQIPILDWSFVSMDGSRDNGGYTTRIKVRDDVGNISDGALVVLFADDRYGTTVQSIGGNSQNRQTIVFVGYIVDGSISYDYATSSIEFEVGSPTSIMKLAEGFSVALGSSTDPTGQAADDENIPSAWVLVKDMDCRRAMYHYLKWHSTVLFTSDVQFLGTDLPIEYFDADRESLYDAINKLMDGTLRGTVCCDRQGKIWSEVSIEATDGAISGSFPNAMVFDYQDWLGTPMIDESLNRGISYIEMGGVVFDFTNSTPFLSCAPGEAPSYRGNVQRIQGLALTSQAQLNKLAGNVFAYQNAKYPQVDFSLVGNYRHLDIAPYETVRVNLAYTDTPRRIVWNQKLFHPTSMVWSYDPRKGIFLPSITLHEVTQGFAGTTMAIPPIPPAQDPGGGGWDLPPIYFPPIYGFPTGTPSAPALCCCGGFVPAKGDGGDCDNSEGGVLMPYGGDCIARGMWLVNGGYTGPLCITPAISVPTGEDGSYYIGVTIRIWSLACGSTAGWQLQYSDQGCLRIEVGPGGGLVCDQGAAGSTGDVNAGDLIKIETEFNYDCSGGGLPAWTDVILLLGWNFYCNNCPD